MKKMILIIMCAVGCSADVSDNNKKDVADVGVDSNVEDVIVEKDSENDIEEIDVNEIENDWNFFMRKPRPDVLTCEDKWPDSDWLCTFEYEGETGTIYSRNTPTSCASGGITPVPLYSSRLFAKIGASPVRELSSAQYDLGGGHQNDNVTFSYGEKTLNYYHSSFGFGFRKCQPMDCIQVYDKDGTLESDGCTTDRTLPIVCVQVEADANYTDFNFVDDFMKCLGDDS